MPEETKEPKPEQPDVFEKAKEFLGIPFDTQRKIEKAYIGLPVWTAVPTYTGFQGEMVWVVVSSVYYLYSYIDGAWRKLATADHGSLDGLSDDDHTQYILAAGTRAFSGEQSMGTNKLTNVVDPTANQDAATKKYVDDNVFDGVWEHIETKTPLDADNVDTLNFTSISTDYYAFKILCLTKFDTSGAGLFMRWNNDSGSNYEFVETYMTGSTTTTATSAPATYLKCGRVNNEGNLTEITISNISGFEKNYFARSSYPDTEHRIYSGVWATLTGQITQITIYNQSGYDFVTGSRVILMGTKK